MKLTSRMGLLRRMSLRRRPQRWITLRRRPQRWITLSGLLLFVFSLQAMGQGCAQCLDSTRSTPPQVQAAYRHAIYLLGGAGVVLFLAGSAILLRHRSETQS